MPIEPDSLPASVFEARRAASCWRGAFERRVAAETRMSAGSWVAPEIWAVVLAAGESRRMGGRPKQLLELEGEPLVRRAVRVALSAGAAGVVVVSGAAAAEVERAVAGFGQRVRTAYNPAYASGMASSLQVGIAALPETATGALVLLADQPRVGAALVGKVLEAGRRAAAAACRYPDGGLGPPCVLNRPVWDEVARLEGDRGARAILRALGPQVAVVRADPAELLDVDTPEDLALLEGDAGGSEG